VFRNQELVGDVPPVGSRPLERMHSEGVGDGRASSSKESFKGSLQSLNIEALGNADGKGRLKKGKFINRRDHHGRNTKARIKTWSKGERHKKKKSSSHSLKGTLRGGEKGDSNGKAWHGMKSAGHNRTILLKH